ncbi:nucleoside-diphosphate-sugar epimerase [Pseudonocardia hierapolitana]|uniref:Nucleoside-diphosphate-sugar epimerase n=1 Tax=Pseudonocardia hierapolitana TaxID=1128676 RepID=A0A561SUX8_9PSEU|nr:NAD(P)-dependent oxidoreductase [Pseudonocardia hierapolitana]TWF78665.1 nucleoside-diphosphate-sugar epimerase [Pseudonocardia hierapolitana]
MTRILLAGSTGVVGRRLVPLLVENGHHVTALTRRPEHVPALRAAGADPAVVDVKDAVALAATVRDVAPEVVVHQLTDLGAADLSANAELRVTGTRNLVDAALAAGARRVVAQSIAWAYAGGDAPAGEDTPLDLDAPEPRATSVRGISALEAAVREAPAWVVLRYGMFYGPDTWFAPGGLRAADARAGRLVADGDVTSFLHVDDAAAAAVAALEWPSGAVNVCDDEPAAGRDWVPAFCEAVGAPAPPVSDAPRREWARGADNRLAREELGWMPEHRSWRQGFALTGAAAR